MDLIADLDAALAAAIRSPAAAPCGRRARRGGWPVTGLAARVTAALERSVLPSVIARGGAVRVAAAADGVVTLEVTDARGRCSHWPHVIEAQLRAAVPGITAVRLVAPGEGRVTARACSSILPRPPAASWMARSTR